MSFFWLLSISSFFFFIFPEILVDQLSIFYDSSIITISSLLILLFKFVCGCVYVCLLAQSCLTLCHPKDCSPPGSWVHGILQARTLQWVVIPFSRGSSRLKNQTRVSCISRWILYPLSPQGSPYVADFRFKKYTCK